jgi:5-methylcytosine-specific restriction endonuclease McrA
MDSVTERISLCSTCIHAKNCILHREKNHPVFYCEHFDTGPSAPSAPAKQDAGRAEESYDESLIGLCMNCEHRKTCKLPKPQGGVWHCEKYA